MSLISILVLSHTFFIKRELINSNLTLINWFNHEIQSLVLYFSDTFWHHFSARNDQNEVIDMESVGNPFIFSSIPIKIKDDKVIDIP